MKAHQIGLLIALAASACGEPQRAATTDLCSGSPDPCPGGVQERERVTTTSAGVTQPKNQGSAYKAQGAANAMSRGAMRGERGERNETSAPSPRPPSGPSQGIEPRFAPPHPINTGDPCGPCQ